MEDPALGLRQRRRDDQDYLLPQTTSPRVQARLPRAEPPRFSCCKLLLTIFVAVPLTLCGFGFYLAVTPGSIDPQYYSMPDPPELTGPLAINDMLTKAERIMEGKISGPESILLDQGKLYTGTYDGKVVEILQREVKRFVQWGTLPCGSYETEPTCGRPLGVRMTARNQLIVADAYLGIYSVNIWEGTFTRLVEGGKLVDGRPLNFLNDVEIVDDDLILFTDSSSKWDRRRFLHIGLEAAGDGRLLSLVPSTGEIAVVLDGLHFPNGIQLSIDRSFVLIAETTMARITRYYLTGPKEGQSDVFKDNLPGFPDNIRLSANGSLWVPLAGIRQKGHFSFLDFLGNKPWLRKIIVKVIPEAKLAEMFSKFKPKHSMIVLVDMEGNYVSSLHDPTGAVIPDISQVADGGTVLFFGSYHSKFIGKLSL